MIHGASGQSRNAIEYYRSTEQGDLAFGDNDGFLDFYDSYAMAPCYLPGTMIATVSGQTPIEATIETLKVGDLVKTADGPPEPVRWHGSRHIDQKVLAANPKIRPIRISAGALGDGTPRTDLFVSPQHRILVRSRIVLRVFGVAEVLLPAHVLTALPGISQMTQDAPLTYHHLLFKRHEIIFANGAESESLLTGEQALRAMGPQARTEIFTIFPQARILASTPAAARLCVNGQRARNLIKRHRRNNLPPVSAANPVERFAKA